MSQSEKEWNTNLIKSSIIIKQYRKQLQQIINNKCWAVQAALNLWILLEYSKYLLQQKKVYKILLEFELS